MSIEGKACDLLILHLQGEGRSVSRQKGTFDLLIDGDVAELKSKGNPFAKLDFITFTENQYQAIKNGDAFDTYVVCGIKDGYAPEAYRLPSQSLLRVEPNIVLSYEYPKRHIKRLVERIF